MNDISELARILEGILGVVAFLLVFYMLMQRLCIDYARDVLFEQREAVFDLAARGVLQFGSEPYEATRDEMNGMIRLAHKLTIWRLGFHWAFGPRSATDDIEAALGQLPAPVRDQVTARLREARAAMLLFMLARSLPAMIVLIVILVAWRVSRVTKDRTLRAADRLFAQPIHEAVRSEAWMAPA